RRRGRRAHAVHTIAVEAATGIAWLSDRGASDAHLRGRAMALRHAFEVARAAATLGLPSDARRRGRLAVCIRDTERGSRTGGADRRGSLATKRRQIAVETRALVTDESARRNADREEAIRLVIL